MGTVESYIEHKRRLRNGRSRAVDPVLAEIAEPLLVPGGSAHRKVVADLVECRRSGRSRPLDETTRSEIYAAFNSHLTWAASRRAPALLCLPLGSGSYRLALTDGPLRMLLAGAAARRHFR